MGTITVSVAALNASWALTFLIGLAFGFFVGKAFGEMK